MVQEAASLRRISRISRSVTVCGAACLLAVVDLIVAGTYQVRYEILQMTQVDKPVIFGFGWTNRPRQEDPTIQHRANNPIRVTGPGVYHAKE